MGRRTTYSPGTPCAVDLATPDRDAAKAFYDRVLGWDAEDLEHGYTAFRRDGALVAGAIALTPAAQAAGAPPAWTTNVAVADLDASLARVTELGGAPVGEGYDIPGAGRGAAFTDPQGAVLLLWEPRGFAGAELVNAVGAWAWNDLQSPEPAAAAPFYEQLFGWAITEVPGSGGAYRMIEHEGRAIGGFMEAPPGVTEPYWNVYFGVEAVGTALEHVEAAGGERVIGPTVVPAGRFAVARDPQGATFSFVESDFDD
jgi:predicted enzyme related to lactoylglutathione lyase